MISRGIEVNQFGQIGLILGGWQSLMKIRKTKANYLDVLPFLYQWYDEKLQKQIAGTKLFLQVIA